MKYLLLALLFIQPIQPEPVDEVRPTLYEVRWPRNSVVAGPDLVYVQGFWDHDHQILSPDIYVEGFFSTVTGELRR